jgi:predicted Zn-dependent peptidase
VPARELARVRAMLEAAQAYDEETVSDIAEELGEHAVDARWQLALEGMERLKAVGPARVRDAARRYLLPERRVVGWCQPATAAKVAAQRRKSSRRAKR